MAMAPLFSLGTSLAYALDAASQKATRPGMISWGEMSQRSALGVCVESGFF